MTGKTQKFSVKRDQWKALPDLNVGRYSHGTCSFKQRYCLVFAGYSFTNADDNNPIEMLDTKKASQGWQVLPLNSKRRLPRLMMPSCVQVGADEILIFAGGKKEVYEFTVSKRRLHKTRTKATVNLETDRMPTVCIEGAIPRRVLTFDTENQKVIQIEPSSRTF